MRTAKQQSWNRQVDRRAPAQEFHERTTPIVGTLVGSWWVNVDRQTFPAIVRVHQARMAKSRFAKAWINDSSES